MILTADQLAERWQVTPGWIYEKTRSGELPATPLPGRVAAASGHVFQVKRQRGHQWYAKYRIGDRQVQKRLGPAHTGKGRCPDGYFTRKSAEAELRRILTDADRGLLAAPDARTFRQACEDYLASCSDVQPKTLRDYRGAIEGRLIPEFGDRRLESIKPKDIDRWRRTLTVSNRTVVRYLTVMHSVFRHARVRDNPASAENLDYPKVKYSGEFVAYDREEIDRLVSAARDDGPLILVAALTGLRQGELLALRWRSVDFVTGMLHVRASYGVDGEKAPKSGRVRAVPMVPDVVDALARLKDRGWLAEDDDLVFASSTGGHLDSYALRRRFYRAIKSAGLRKIRFHDLRHTFGTTGARVLSLSDLQHYMGHQHAVTTQRYIHHQPRPEDAAKLAEAFRVPNPAPLARTEANSEG